MSNNKQTRFSLRKGLSSDLPNHAPLGEPLFCTDTGELYVGMGSGSKPKPVTNKELSDKLTTVSSQLEHITQQNSINDIKSKKYNIGDKIESSIYGGSTWIVKNITDVKFQWNYQLDYDDELHQIVNLKGGGTAIAECQISSIIDYAKACNRKAFSKYYLNLNEHKTTKIGCYGNSLTYGQYNGDGCVVAIGTPVNQEYPRTHEFNHLQKPYPLVLEETIASVYNLYGKFISTDNRARSGDTLTDCYRGCRVNKNYDIALFEFGVNDASLCTSGGSEQNNITDDSNINNVFITTEVYKKLLVREMLRGSGVIMMLPHRYYNFNSAMATKKFCNSFRNLSKELEILCIDWNEFLGDYEIHQITHDNIHLNDFGAEVVGKRLASILIGWGHYAIEKIVGERHLTMSKMKDNIITYSGIYENWNSFSPSFYSKGQSDDIILAKDKPLYLPFYLEEDKKLVMPIGRIQSESGSITYELNFGIKQPEFKLDIEENDRFEDNHQGGLTNLNKAPSSSITITNTSSLEFNSNYINRPKDITEHLCIQGKGWHTLIIKNNTDNIVMLNGVRFFNDNTVTIKKVDAY